MQWVAFVVLIGTLLASVYTWMPDIYYRPVLFSTAIAIVLLSVVVLTGYAGQLSLAQFTLAGVAAFVAGHVAADAGWPFFAAVIVGVACSAAIGAVMALPAIRMRGVNFAVLTLGFATVMYAAVLNQTETLETPAPSFLGIDLSMLTSPKNYVAFAVVLFTVCVVVVANLRRSATGLRMIAVRGNERAASSMGINVVWTKTVAFTISAGVAGFGGVIIAFQSPVLTFAEFSPYLSTEVVSWATIGGIGLLLGPVIGSFLAPGGMGTVIGSAIYDNTAVLGFVGGILVILTLIVHPDGAASLATQFREHRAHRRAAADSKARPTHQGADVPSTAPRGEVPVLPAAQHGKVLQVSGINVNFGGVQALTDVTFTVQPGTVHGLIGSNGAGKTTLLDVISGFTKAKTGGVRLGDDDLGHLVAWRRARLGFGRSFQNGQLLPELSVRDNLRIAGSARSGNVARDLVAPTKIYMSATALSAAQTLELSDVLDTRVENLSHGKKQMVSIARALATAPSFVLLDEPAAGLDDNERLELGALLRRLATDLNIGILLVEHDVQLVLSVCDVVTVLHNGHVIAEGSPEVIRESAAVQEAYLGEPIEGVDIDAEEDASDAIAAVR